MKNLLQILFAVLFLGSCNMSNETVNMLESDLERIELSLSSKLSKKQQKLQIDLTINPEKWGPTKEKLSPFLSLSDSLLRIVHAGGNTRKNVEGIVTEFRQGIERLNLHDEYFELTRNQRLNYWISNDFKQVQSNALAIDLRFCVLDVIEELSDDIQKSSFSFNVVNPIIIEASNIVSVGETYTARIGLQAFDSTSAPLVRIDGIDLEVINGFGIYRARSNIKGEKIINGEILLDHNGFVISRTFKESYIVK